MGNFSALPYFGDRGQGGGLGDAGGIFGGGAQIDTGGPTSQGSQQGSGSLSGGMSAQPYLPPSYLQQTDGQQQPFQGRMGMYAGGGSLGDPSMLNNQPGPAGLAQFSQYADPRATNSYSAAVIPPIPPGTRTGSLAPNPYQ